MLTGLIILVVAAWFFALWLVWGDLQRLAAARRELAKYPVKPTIKASATPGDDDPGPLHFSPEIEPIITQAQQRRQRRAKR